MTPLAERTAAALDATVLAERAGITPDDWQAGLLRNRHQQICLLACRQSGKSTVSALLVVDEMLNAAPALCLLVSPSLRQSAEQMRSVKAFLHANKDVAPPITQESVLSVELASGSRCVALPGSEATIRGYSGVSLLVVDEASRVPDAVFSAISPMLSVSNGRRIYLSTPHGARGEFWRVWTEGIGWIRVKITAADCPRISAEFLAAERAALPRHIFAAEYDVEFVEGADGLFDMEAVRKAYTDVPAFFPHRLREYAPVG